MIVEELIDRIFPKAWVGRLCVLMIAILIVMIPATIYIGVKDRERWDAFVKANKCKVVDRIASEFSVARIPTTRTGWLCNDGVTYWR